MSPSCRPELSTFCSPNWQQQLGEDWYGDPLGPLTNRSAAYWYCTFTDETVKCRLCSGSQCSRTENSWAREEVKRSRRSEPTQTETPSSADLIYDMLRVQTGPVDLLQSDLHIYQLSSSSNDDSKMDFTTKHNNSALQQVAVSYFYDPFMFGCFLNMTTFCFSLSFMSVNKVERVSVCFGLSGH